MLNQNVSRLRPSNPQRPVNWRWLLAEYLQCETSKPASCEVDDCVIVAADSLNGTCESESLQTAFNSRDATTAHAIWIENGWDRCLLECWILTGTPLEEVAKQLGISHETVMAYHALLFDVRSRLMHPAFVTHAAIRIPVSFAPPMDLETAFRAFAGHGGVKVLCALMAAYRKEVKTKYVRCNPGPHGLSSAQLRRIRRAITIFQTPVTETNALSWYENIGAGGKLGSHRPKRGAASRRLRRQRVDPQSQQVEKRQADE